MYTSIENVRTLTGFTDTTNFPNNKIADKIRIAESLINAAIAYNYTLPLPYRYFNSISFTGEATGEGDMDIVINGVTYTVAVVATDNATSIADKFRIAAKDSVDFRVDDLGEGDIVSIVSLTDSNDNVTTAYAEVNVTSVETVAGMSGTIWTRVKRFPGVIEQFTGEIAQALLFIDQYGVESQNSGKDGQTRMDVINELLQKIQGVHKSGQRIKIIDDITGVEIPVAGTIGVSSYPNETSNEDADDPTSPIAFMNKVF